MKFVKYRITWKFTDEGDDCAADFYLPEGADPHKEVGDLINLVELSASEYDYAYDLKVVTPTCPKCGAYVDSKTQELDYYDNMTESRVVVDTLVHLNCRECDWGDTA